MAIVFKFRFLRNNQTNKSQFAMRCVILNMQCKSHSVKICRSHSDKIRYSEKPCLKNAKKEKKKKGFSTIPGIQNSNVHFEHNTQCLFFCYERLYFLIILRTSHSFPSLPSSHFSPTSPSLILIHSVNLRPPVEFNKA